MKNKRVLYVSSEVTPYTPQTEMSEMSFEAAKKAHHKGIQTRIFMPRFGLINERRHQLHEVIRLSGMNLIINDMDMPLIIKVASIPKERMQVYFIDNEEYFKRKATFTDENDEMFIDNDERAIFFAKGVVETVKKLNWAPDIIHVHGWMACLLPLYLREYYKDDALFANTKIVTSVYDNEFEGTLDVNMINKVRYDEIPEDKLTILENPTFSNILKSAIDNSDAVVKASRFVNDELEDYLDELEKPFLDYQTEDTFAEAYLEFYSEKVLN
ncbi:glycogen/starch synthase [Wenyingzhuangia sp. 2_MG-2023]|uniref:glycogen/starch synthase n=1 Tax=Wenyingzhuangia sp. 2_MG-2023 TaxID=3062639 RepID=UPI0026E43DC5|nr:glycogen/starch synthase [Wenyingzhuangia sp. 2_MG-2023]MDO6736815.1 glycogen/starch synthase [Wenyingzhuangia sp. 2_MG-2023]MDO6800889.1 glycogen/starch synthase [Wenyingzhuangia sp. 1_MG-2023]